MIPPHHSNPLHKAAVMPILNMDDVCTCCGKREPEAGWYATFGIGLRPEWFCSPECFEKVGDAEDEEDASANNGEGADPLTTDEIE